MAELAIGAVSAALALCEIIIPHLLDKINVKEDIKDGIRSMKDLLTSMEAFLEDTDGREGSTLLKDKVEKVRKKAYEIEDILDEFLLHTQPYISHNHKLIGKVHYMAHNVRHGFPLREISKRIEIINKDMRDFGSHHAALAIPGPSTSSHSRAPHRVSHFILDHDIVGYERPKEQLIRLLKDSKRKLVKVAVVGPSGSGKTTIVKNVNRERGIWGQFDCHAWVHVSSHSGVDELSNDMLKQFRDSRKEPHPSDESSDKLSKLSEYLTGKKYIVVLDDLQEIEQWDNIKNAFTNSLHNSRIIFTTRSKDIANMCASSPDHICSLQNGLEPPDAWSLFCREAFPEKNGECPPELVEISKRIVEECEGLPLAIVAVGSALAQKPRKTPNEWGRFQKSLRCELGSNKNLSRINNALLSGYMDLSRNLKSCFLYFSIFPEDGSIGRGRLIRLWVAEGFVKGTDNLTAEEVAQENLEELIRRNLVHVSKLDVDGRPRNCRVPNLVHHVIIQKCKNENYASVLTGTNTCQSEKIRRLSLHNGFSHFPQNINFSGVRSMFLFRSSNITPSEFAKKLPRFKLIRVLDLQDAPLTAFPIAVTHLPLLRYLSLRGTNINTIPSSIENLSFLETLDLKQTNVTELPKEISHLHNLRHLFAYKYNVDNFVLFNSVQGVKISEGISNLTNLQKLSIVKVDPNGQILKHLLVLIQLRKLGLVGLKVEHGRDLRASIEKMQVLRTLDLSSSTKEECLELGEMESPPPTLERLYLKGRLNKLPEWISNLNNLLRIGLKWSKMVNSPLKALQHLPLLIELQLVDSYIGEELIFEALGFKKLEILLIEDFSKLHMIKIEQRALPELKEISLQRCPRLGILPLGIENLAKVEKMILYDMSEEFICRLRKGSDDRVLVERIPVIHSSVLGNHNSWSFENLSASFS